MKLDFLGTGHGTPSDIRFSTSILVETENGARYVFDAGAPLLDVFQRRHYDPNTIHAIFISHMHSDHIGGLFMLLDNVNWRNDCSFPVYLPEERGIELLNLSSLAMGHRPFREGGVSPKLYEEGVVHEDENIKVTAVRVDHVPGWNTYGFLIEADGKRVYFSGDMSYDLHDFPTFLYNTEVDLLITELAHPKTEDMIAALEKCHAPIICLNHISPEGRGEELVAKAAHLPAKLYVTSDGDIFEL